MKSSSLEECEDDKIYNVFSCTEQNYSAKCQSEEFSFVK